MNIMFKIILNLKKGGLTFFKLTQMQSILRFLQFCPAMSLLGFPEFCSSSSIVLSHYFDILVNSMTI